MERSMAKEHLLGRMEHSIKENLSNKRHGQGTIIWSNGDKYTGLWKNGEMDGYGSYFWGNNADKYIGEFLNEEAWQRNIYLV